MTRGVHTMSNFSKAYIADDYEFAFSILVEMDSVYFDRLEAEARVEHCKMCQLPIDCKGCVLDLPKIEILYCFECGFMRTQGFYND